MAQRTEKPTTIVVPCYNEEERLDLCEFVRLVDEPDISVLFVDDGSEDGTALLLSDLCAENDSMDLLGLPQNVGKGEAVRRGLLDAIDRRAEFVGYFDADLATPVDELIRLIGVARSSQVMSAVLGSRVALLGSDIDRSGIRHVLGRVFATFASAAVDLTVYDTQCGAKVFRVEDSLLKTLDRPFLARWAFDVELLARLRSEHMPLTENRIIEVPLRRWHDVAGSKLSLSARVTALRDLLSIWFVYRWRAKRHGR